MGLPDVNLNGGSISGLSPNTLYYVFHDDPGFAGGNVKYAVTTVKEQALLSAGRFFDGSILTPRAGSSVIANGNGDGGVGVQSGMTNLLLFSSAVINPNQGQAGNAAVSNITRVIDGDLTSFATFTATGNNFANIISYIFQTPPGITRKYSSINLNVLYSIPTNTIVNTGAALPIFGISFQTVTAFPLFSVTGALAGGSSGASVPPTLITTAIAIPPCPVNLSQTVLVISLSLPATCTSGSFQANIYDAHIEAVE